MGSARVRGALYLIGCAPPDDPLDPVAPAREALGAYYDEIITVGPGREASLRAFRRSFQPQRDRALFDLTAPGDLEWALDAVRETPAACMISARCPIAPMPALASLRSARRYAHQGFRLPPAAAVGGLDCSPPSLPVDMVLHRPAATPPPAEAVADAAIMIAPGAIEGAYAVLLDLRPAAPRLALIAETERDASDARDIAEALGLEQAWVIHAETRRAIADATASARALIDITMSTDAGLSDAGLVARCIGAPVLDVVSPGAGASALGFLKDGPPRDPSRAKAFAAARRPEDFAASLYELAELGAKRATMAERAA